MSLFNKLSIWVKPKTVSTDVVFISPNEDFPLTENRDIEVAQSAQDSLEEQIHAVINKNADGVNKMALSIRRDTDLLLTLGISDPFAAKAGTLAQAALELANAGRGVNLQCEKHVLTPTARVQFVSKAMSVVTRAELLLRAAKEQNRASIDSALDRQAKIISGMRAGSLANSLE